MSELGDAMKATAKLLAERNRAHELLRRCDAVVEKALREANESAAQWSDLGPMTQGLREEADELRRLSCDIEQEIGSGGAATREDAVEAALPSSSVPPGAAANRQERSAGTGAEEAEDWPVTVCSACRMAACWHGDHCCEVAYRASTVTVLRSQLEVEGREHWEYWEADRPGAADPASQAGPEDG